MARNAEEAAQLAQRRAQGQLAGKISKIAAQAKATRSTGLRVPELEADPASDDPTNAWLLADGRLCWRTLDGVTHRIYPAGQQQYPILTRATDPASSTGIDFYHHGPSDEYRIRRPDGTWARYAAIVPAVSSDGGGNTGGGSTSTKPKPADPTPKRYRKTYSPTWGRGFCPQHGMETGGNLRYGTFPGSHHGNRRIMIGLDDAGIRADLAGSTIRRVEVHMRNTDSWAYSGISVHFGAHNRSAVPNGFSAVRRNVWSNHWPHSGDGQEWRNAPEWFGKALRDNSIKGVTVDQPSGSAAYYGELDWSSFRLRVTYTK